MLLAAVVVPQIVSVHPARADNGGYPWPDPTPEEEELYARYGAAKEAQDVAALVEIGLAEWCRSGTDDYLTEQMRRSIEADFAQDHLEQPNPEQWERLEELRQSQLPRTFSMPE